MNYVFAVLFPPIAMLLVKRNGLAFVLLVLMITFFGWPLAALVALLVVKDYHNAEELRLQADYLTKLLKKAEEK